MFDNLSTKIHKTFKNLTGKGKITEDNIKDALREIRVALLEADVNFQIVKSFIAEVREKADGQEVLLGVNPGQQFVKIVYDHLVDVLGGETAEVALKDKPSVIMMVGLQGSGKTTTSAKLSKFIAEQFGKYPLLVPCDVYRPAAIQQLQTVGQQVGIPVFDSVGIAKPQDIVKRAMTQAKNTGRDTLIIDTAGRLHIDDALMEELKELKSLVSPGEILFVADSMTGQDAVNSAKAFHEALDITGVVLTKLDGDARGGAALSIKKITDRPIKFVGTGEKFDAFERFHPDRVASRILGMGDILSLVEKVQAQVDEEEAIRLQQAMLKNQFTLEDFSKSLDQFGKMGDMGSLMSLIPGMSQIKEKMDVQAESKQLRVFKAIINSMTPQERQNHALLNQKRKNRIAKGSGRTVNEVNQMINQFVQMRKMMGMFNKPSKLGKLTQMFKQAGMGDFAQAVLPGMQRGTMPADIDEAQLQELIAQHGGQVTPELRKQLGIATPRAGQGSGISRPKKDRKKEKQKRKQGRKKKR